MNISFLPMFSVPEMRLWERIPKDKKALLLSNLWSGNCQTETTIVNVRTSQPQILAEKLLRKLAADGKAQALSSND